MEIKYLKHSDIDKTKWDKLIQSSPHGKIYAFSWYLDCVADNWDALIAGDYEEVFPLPWNRRIAFKRIYQPIFSQQLGLFTLENEISKNRVEEYLLKIPSEFKLINIHLNDANPAPNLENWYVEERINIELSLNVDYKSIQKKYHESQLKSIRRSSHFNLVVHDTYPIDKLMDALLNFISHKAKNIIFNNRIKKKVLELARTIINKDKGLIRIVKDSDDKLHLVKLLFKSERRIYNIMGAPTKLGRNSVANSYILNQIIKEYANSDFVFDFEGSMIPGVANFFRSFGGEEKKYYFISNNRLPAIINKLLKFFKSLKPN